MSNLTQHTEQNSSSFVTYGKQNPFGRIVTVRLNEKDFLRIKAALDSDEPNLSYWLGYRKALSTLGILQGIERLEIPPEAEK